MISSTGDNLIFLLSLPRSGSTLLSLLLGGHSAVLCPPEPWFLLKLAELKQPGNVNSVFGEEWTTRSSADFLPDTLFLDASRNFALTAYNEHLHRTKKDIFIDKTPRYYHILDFIDRLFPRAKKIWLQRNPLDVALSYKRTWHVGTNIISGQQLTSHTFDFTIGPFQLAEYFKKISPYNFILQYEKLVQAPEQILPELCRFLNITFHEEMLAYSNNKELLGQHQQTKSGDKTIFTLNKIHTDSISRWQEEFAAEEIQELINVLGEDIFYQMEYGDTLKTISAMGISICNDVIAQKHRDRILERSFDGTAEIKAESAARLDLLNQQGGEIDALKQQIRAHADALHEKDLYITLLQNSYPYKVGSFLLAPFKLLKDALSASKTTEKEDDLQKKKLSLSQRETPQVSYSHTALLSVIIPNYNNASYLEACLQSVLRQTYPHLEILIVDDCSTDNSRKILQDYEVHHANIRVMYLPQNTGLVGMNRHRAILAARGEYITTLDSDDVYLDDTKLEREMDVLLYHENIREQKVIAFSDVVYIDRNGQHLYRMGEERPIVEGGILPGIISRRCMIPTHFTYSKSIYLDVGGYDEAFAIYEDWDLKIRMASRYEYYYTGILGSGYHRHGQGLSASSSEIHANYLQKVLDKNLHLVNERQRPEVQQNIHQYILAVQKYSDNNNA